ncbi:MAG: LptF/LptG family permease [Bacteroidetes bacterium]|nr:LptF/LptG family permease [Rhodothermia bacterium]MCS7154211.1 LptF/LptG family permease [Bacteroidota bacterium]MCX7906753.1 LptF/LptG family permease [Bacteroidota bacterium]MDW8136967.1 LptF/LptG family permease [Bacteroidota bacterium]MDW8285162.1 LptF/LptG family permease [Bacteroidota bacterium]
MKSRLKLLDRYLGRQLLAVYWFLMGAFVAVFVLLDFVEHMDDFYDRAIPWRVVLGQYYAAYLPEMIKLVSPAAVFVATLFVSSRLAQRSELIAFRAAGVSPGRMLRPYAVLGLSVVLFMEFFNGWVVPRANRTRIAFENRYFMREGRLIEASNVFRQNGPTSFLGIGYFDRQERIGYSVVLQEFDRPFGALVRRIDAARMHWVDSLRRWRFEEVYEQRFLPEGVVLHERRSWDTTLALSPRDLARDERDVEQMTISEARSYLELLERTGASHIDRPRVDYYAKFAYPIANFVVILLGFPLASVRRRGGMALALTAGLLLSFAYMGLIKLFEPFGYEGELHPLLVVWAPHFCFALLGLGLLWRYR